MTQATKPASANRVRVFDRAGSSASYQIRDFLSRTVVNYDWVDLTCEEDCRDLLGLADFEALRFPVVDLPSGHRIFAPSVRDIADRLGWVQKPRYREYDLSIYGAGPAGLSAAVYAASEGLRTVLIEKHAVGGQAGTSSLIENYMGFPEGISGASLAERARQQAVKFGTELIMMSEGVEATFSDNKIHARLADGDTLVAKSNICATGVEYRRLGVAHESRFLGAGLFYGAGAAEAPYCRDREVFVVGGGNSAGQAVMHFAHFARKVVMLVRGASLSDSLSQYLVDRITAQPNVEVLYQTEISRLSGQETLEAITLRDRASGDEHEIAVTRVFVCIGGVPNTEWASRTEIVRDRAGYLVTGPDLFKEGALPACWTLERQPFYLETSVPGCFATGDVRHGSIKRVASAVGEGAMAVSFVHRFLEEHH